jgi:hypothetical protein
MMLALLAPGGVGVLVSEVSKISPDCVQSMKAKWGDNFDEAAARSIVAGTHYAWLTPIDFMNLALSPQHAAFVSRARTAPCWLWDLGETPFICSALLFPRR